MLFYIKLSPEFSSIRRGQIIFCIVFVCVKFSCTKNDYYRVVSTVQLILDCHTYRRRSCRMQGNLWHLGCRHICHAIPRSVLLKYISCCFFERCVRHVSYLRPHTPFIFGTLPAHVGTHRLWVLMVPRCDVGLMTDRILFILYKF